MSHQEGVLPPGQKPPNGNGSVSVSQFFSRHSDSVVTICITVVCIAMAWARISTELDYVQRDMEALVNQERQDIISMTNRIGEIEKGGTGLSQAHKFLLEQHSKEIVEMKADQRKITDTLADMRSDLRLITSWVRNQNGGELLKQGSDSRP